MFIAIPKERYLVKKQYDAELGSFKSQTEDSYLEVIKNHALKYVKRDDDVLVMIGRSLPANESSLGHVQQVLREAGCKNVTFLLENDKLIKSIKKKVGKKGGHLDMIQGSPMVINNNIGLKNVVLDLCSIQNFLSNPSNLENNSNEIFANICKILKDGGRFLCMMDAEENIIDRILTHFKDSWFIRIQCFQMSTNSAEKSLEVFSPLALLTLTKLKIKLPKPVFEIANKTEKARRVDEEDVIKKELTTLWSYSYLQRKLRQEFDTKTYVIDIWCPRTNSESPRYTVYIVDSANDELSQYYGKYGVFIVPFGREISWLFASEKGRRDLAKMAGFERLAITSTHRRHSYGCLDDIQQELSSKVLQLAPPGLNASAKVPFLTVGDDVGQRDIVFESGSALDGYVVEDVKMDDGYFYRRLIFKRSPTLVQSEFRISNDSIRDGLQFEQRKMEFGHLVFLFHRRMIATLSFIDGLSLTSSLKILLIGLGGGALPSFMAKAFPNATIICVEMDPEVVDIAKKWFGYKEDSQIKSIIADGLDFMSSEIEQGHFESYDAIIFDVNTDDDSMAITGPPMAFLENSVIENVRRLLKPSGVFNLNLVCRDGDLKAEIIGQLKGHFKNARTFPGDDDELNLVVMCLSPGRQDAEPSNSKCLEIITQIADLNSKASDSLGFRRIMDTIVVI